jgi:hypothetical protein
MALFDELPNLFLTQKPEYLQGLLGAEKYKQLEQQSNISGLLNTFVNFVAQPKNQGYGSIIPYAAKSYLAGTSGAQNVYDTRTKNVLDALNVAKTTKQIEMEGMTELDKLIYNRGKLAELDPQSPYLKAYDDKISKESGGFGGFGTSLEGSSLNLLARGSQNNLESEKIRSTPQYALAWRDATQAKTVLQDRINPTTGQVTQVPVKIQPAPLPEGILPPIGYGYEKAKPTGGVNVAATTDTSNLKAAPTALTEGQATKYKEKIDAGNLLNSTLDALKQDIQKNGMQLMGLGERGAYQASLYEDALTQIRINAELGVLNVQDLPRIMKSLPSPTEFATYIKGGGSPDAIMGALEQLKDQNTRKINYFSQRLNPESAAKPAGAGGGLMLDLDAISKELKRRKGGG